METTTKPAERGVEVLYLQELLAETLDQADVRNQVVGQTVQSAALGPIAGSELGRGRGGPRCMSCPIERDALPTT